MSLKYVDELSLAENIVKTKEHVESVRAALDSAKQNIIEYATIPSPSADVLGLFIIYTGATNSTYTHGYVYECVSDGGDPATYTWEQRNVQDGVAVDGVTIVKDASTDEISAVTATNSTKGIVKGSDDVSIDADGAMTVNDRVKEVNALPTASVDLLDECYLLRSVQTGYDLGKIYQCQALEVVPEGTENPSEEGWYELDGTTYELSADTSVDAGKTYYEIKWVSISSANLEAGRGITIDGSVINANTNTFTGTQAEWDELSTEEKKEYDIANFTDDGETGDITDVVESGNHNAVESDAVFDSEQNIYEVMGKLGAKNLLPFPYYNTSKTDKGITWTVNSDGSISASGTATENSFFRLTQDSDLSIYNNTILSGCPANGEMWSKWALYLSGNKDGQSITKIDVGSGVLIEDIPAGYSGGLYAKVINGQTVNFTFKPMVRLASIKDDTYEPYSMTNREMTPYVQAISNPNLLDNPWFTVNQRGLSTYSNVNYSYTVDRWLGSSGFDLYVDSDGVSVSAANKSIFQRIDSSLYSQLVGRTVTLSVMKANGSIVSVTGIVKNTGNSFAKESDSDVSLYLTKDSIANFVQIAIKNTTVKVRAVKLELGTVSTLTMDTVPNYQQELAKCQRYYQEFRSTNENDWIALGFASTATAFEVILPLIVPMRVKPTITMTDCNVTNASQQDVSLSTINLVQSDANNSKIHLNIAPTANLTNVLGSYALKIVANSGKLALSADL